MHTSRLRWTHWIKFLLLDHVGGLQIIWMTIMDKELEKYYLKRFEMFSHTAWKDLIEDVQNMMDATNTLSGVTPENVGFKQGEVSIMRWILTLQKTTEESYKELTNADD